LSTSLLIQIRLNNNPNHANHANNDNHANHANHADITSSQHSAKKIRLIL
jgi:hypothetical protein